jgi:hypothetical protein
MLDVLDHLKCLSTLGIDRELAKAVLSSTPVFALTLVSLD